MVIPQSSYAASDDNALFQLLKTQNWDMASNLLSEGAQPELARETDRYGNTPLHTAIGFQAPSSLLRRLLDLHPGAAHVHGTDDWLPLHVAAMWGSSADVLERLIRLHPDALDDQGEPGIKGRTPRHFAPRFDDARREMLERPTAEWRAHVGIGGGGGGRNEETNDSYS